MDQKDVSYQRLMMCSLCVLVPNFKPGTHGDGVSRSCGLPEAAVALHRYCKNVWNLSGRIQLRTCLRAADSIRRMSVCFVEQFTEVRLSRAVKSESDPNSNGPA